MSGITPSFTCQQVRALGRGHVVYRAEDGSLHLRPPSPAADPTSAVAPGAGGLLRLLAALPLLRHLPQARRLRSSTPLPRDSIIRILRNSLDERDRMELLASNVMVFRGPVAAVARRLVNHFTALNASRFESVLDGLRLGMGSALREAVAARVRQRLRDEICLRQLHWHELRAEATLALDALTQPGPGDAGLRAAAAAAMRAEHGLGRASPEPRHAVAAVERASRLGY
jgi:hypothetical protein